MLFILYQVFSSCIVMPRNVDEMATCLELIDFAILQVSI